MDIFIDIDDDPNLNLKEQIEYIENLKNYLKKRENIKHSFSIIFVSSTKQRELNKSYRNLDRTTDVLSFNYDDDELNLLGELYIDPYQAQKQAKRYSVSFKNELIRLIVHGFLHLIGFDHSNPKERKEMFSLQENLISEFLSKNGSN